jgi:glutamate synthase (NADPH/NADH) large chain
VQKVVNYFRFVAEEVRDIMAQLGVRRLADLIGRTDLLECLPGSTQRQQHLDLSPLLAQHGVAATKPHYCLQPANTPFDKAELAARMWQDTRPAIEAASGGEWHYAVKNSDRSIGARLSGEIARRHGNLGMATAPITLRLTGTAGQSFGVWNAGGLQLYLEGDANDYVGKGMAGGKLVLSPPSDSAFQGHETPIIGNTCLYGATGGKLFAAGIAGERFAVRNSGALAVVEGVGDHGCEYMTGGVVLVLGKTGLNFGAGMTGGFALVLDQAGQFQDRYNHELVDTHRISPANMRPIQDYLRDLLEEYLNETRSPWAQRILREFNDFIEQFWLVKPKAAELHSLMTHLLGAA